MKKHPVDDLFKRKLEGLERTPSAHAWLKIQERQPAKRRPLVWEWYAAAGVAVAVTASVAPPQLPRLAVARSTPHLA